MDKNEKIQKFYDARGKLLAVLVPVELWLQIERLITPGPDKEIKEDLAGFAELMQCWTFRYPYKPEVKCPVCGQETKDWLADEPRLFLLVSANIGGLMVFHCQRCASTIRHKYFREHMTTEVTPA